MGDSFLPEILVQKESRQGNCPRRSLRPDEVMSTITGDTLVIFRKKYHFPNDLVVKLPTKSDKACSPPPGYITLYEMSLQAGVRFPLSSELVVILSACEICISQLSCRVLTIIVGLIVFFREHSATLTPEILARICRFSCDAQGRISCRSKWLDLRTRDPPKNWSSRFFFVKNEWDLLEKWGKLKDLPVPLHVGEEDILRALNILKLEDLQYELRYINKYVVEESLFKVGLSVHAGRSHALMLKASKETSNVASKMSSKRPISVPKGGSRSPLKKKKVEEPAVVLTASTSSPLPEQTLKLHIPEETFLYWSATSSLSLQRQEVNRA